MTASAAKERQRRCGRGPGWDALRLRVCWPCDAAGWNEAKRRDETRPEPGERPLGPRASASSRAPTAVDHARQKARDGASECTASPEPASIAPLARGLCAALISSCPAATDPGKRTDSAVSKARRAQMPPTRSAPQGAAPRRTAANNGVTPAPPTSSTTLSAGSQPAPVLVASGSVPSRTTEVQTTASTSHAYRPSPLDSLLAEQGLTRYHLEPPSWRAPWLRESRTPTPEPGVKPLASRTPLIRLAGAPVVPGVAGAAGGGRNGADASADKGRTKPWPVFYPPRDGMDEDQMTEAIVKSGFSAKSVVQASRPSTTSALSRLLRFLLIRKTSKIAGRDVLRAPAHLRQAQDDRCSRQPEPPCRCRPSESRVASADLRVRSICLSVYLTRSDMRTFAAPQLSASPRASPSPTPSAKRGSPNSPRPPSHSPSSAAACRTGTRARRASTCSRIGRSRRGGPCGLCARSAASKLWVSCSLDRRTTQSQRVCKITEANLDEQSLTLLRLPSNRLRKPARSRPPSRSTRPSSRPSCASLCASSSPKSSSPRPAPRPLSQPRPRHRLRPTRRRRLRSRRRRARAAGASEWRHSSRRRRQRRRRRLRRREAG